MADMQTTGAVNFSGLLTTPTEADVAVYRAANAARVRMQDGGPIARAFVAVVFWLTVGAFAGSAVIGIVIALSAAVTSGNYLWSLVLLVPIALGCLLIAGMKLAEKYPIGSMWVQLLQLNRFAHDNGYSFAIESTLPPLPGSAFPVSSVGTTYWHLRSKRLPFVEVANYMVGGYSADGTPGGGAGGYIAIRLERQLPNIVLKSHGMQLFSAVPRDFDAMQVLHLEGNFNEHFTLHAPRGYETDALYIFAPDLMALLIDKASGFEVEIVDDWLFVYSDLPIVRADAKWMARIFSIIRTVGAKTRGTSTRYRDERVGDFAANRIAQPGQRLGRTGVPRLGAARWIVVAFTVVSFIIPAAIFIAVFFSTR